MDARQRVPDSRGHLARQDVARPGRRDAGGGRVLAGGATDAAHHVANRLGHTAGPLHLVGARQHLRPVVDDDGANGRYL